MLSVVMLTWEFPPHMVGGLARHVHALSRELATRGHRVIVLTRAAPGLPDWIMEEGVEVHRVQPYFQEPRDFALWVNHLNFALLQAGIQVLQRESGPAILHAHDWLVAHAAKGLKNLFRLPLMATIHATEHGRHGGIHNSGQQYINDVEWWLTYESWRVVVCSEAMRTEVRLLFGLSDDKVVVIPNGIDFKTPAGTRDRGAYVRPGERLLFHLGRLVPEKGAGVLLEALSFLRDRHPVRLVIGGVGPYKAELERRVHLLGLQDRVRFAGWVSDQEAQSLYAHSDVAVVPSTYEPFGIVALEAMAAGAPLVASDVGGLSEIVVHGQTGLKAYPGDPQSLATQIHRLLSDRELAGRLAAEAKRQVRQRYAWSSVAAATASEYRAVAELCARTPWAASLFMHGQPPEPGPAPGRYTT